MVHVRLNTKATEYLPKFLDRCLKVFPTDVFLHEMRAICYTSYEQHGDALKLLESALKSHPNNVRLLYARATALSLMEHKSSADVIKAWETFLAIAPKDHPKTPAAYYRKAIQMGHDGLQMGSDVSKLVECYEKGLAAEKLQLPCFLPYNFSPKYLVERIYSATKKLGQKKLGQDHIANVDFNF